MGHDDGSLVINFAALHQASMDINKALQTLNGQLHQLETDANPLVASWDGAAKEAYQQRQNSWRQAAQDLEQMLRDIKSALDESAERYRAAEDKNTKSFQH